MTNDPALLHNVIRVLSTSHSVWENVPNDMK